MSAPTPDPGGGWRPVPDPTVLTTAQLIREMANLREIIEARLDAMDRATALVAENVNRTPTMIDRQVGQLQLVVEERFKAIHQRFGDRDLRFDQQALANANALAAALQAARELGELQNRTNALANAKTEESVAQQLKALSEKVDFNRARLDAGASAASGRRDQVESSSRALNTRIALAVAATGVLVVVVNVIIALVVHHG